MPELRRRQHRRRGPLPRLHDLADLGSATHDDHLREPATRRSPGSLIGSVLRWFVLGAVLLLAAPLAVLGADPTFDPGGTPRPPTCAQRFPEDGPAGVDLRLGCIVGEVVGLYAAGQPAPPAPLSTYVIVLAMLVVGGLVVVLLVGRMLARRAGRRLAPVLAGAWWVCSSCHSVNGVGVAHCYSCGAAPPDGPMLRTDDAPATPQSFGGTRKRG